MRSSVATGSGLPRISAFFTAMAGKKFTAVVLGSKVDEIGGELVARLPKTLSRLRELGANQIIFMADAEEAEAVRRWLDDHEEKRRRFDLIEFVRLVGEFVSEGDAIRQLLRQYDSLIDMQDIVIVSHE